MPVVRLTHNGHVSTPVALLLCGLAAVAAGWALTLVVADRPMTDALFWALAVVEVCLFAQTVGGFVALGLRSRPIEGLTFGAYLVTVVLVLPAAVLWGVSDKSRWGTGVLAIGSVTVIVLQFRLLSLWGAGGV